MAGNTKQTKQTKSAAHSLPPELAARDSQMNEALADANGWTKHDTADAGATYEQSEWVEPGEGTVIEGTLTRAFVIKDTLGGRKPFRACYAVTDAQGNIWTFGEKAGFERAIRSQRMGVELRLEFKGKQAQTDKQTGRPTGKSIWVTDFFTKQAGTGVTVMEALDKSLADLRKSGGDREF